MVSLGVKSGLWFLSIWLPAILISSIAIYAQLPDPDITCQNGSGEYRTQFSTGTTVSVGPMRSGAFADRACAANLEWNGQQKSVVFDAAQVGIDALGADLGFGKPVVAFQIDESGSGSKRRYQIYSLAKPPQLLYSIGGGSTYRAADTDLDGEVEIWTDDAEAVDGFERIPSLDLDFPPTVVLRFEKGNLVDVGSEFLSFYDAQVARLRAEINEHDLAEFRISSGSSSPSLVNSGQELHKLIRTKISVLEIVWAYLYSGREQEAWSALNKMWPAGDLDRIRTAILKTYQNGILHNLYHSHRPMHTHHVKIYDAISTPAVQVSTLNPYGGAPGPLQAEPPILEPKSILLRRPPPSAAESFTSTNETIELVVDAAGKVHSAQIIGGNDRRLVEASAGWQFIPAFREGRPVACRFRLSVWALK